jgi:hypothetical protein
VLRPPDRLESTARAYLRGNSGGPPAPSSSHIDPAVITTFLAQQERLLRLMEASRGLDLEATTITSPVARIITYSLLDA